MPESPKISAALAKKHACETAISLLNGRVVAFGKNAVEALRKAKKIMPNIENEEFVISRVHGKILIA